MIEYSSKNIMKWTRLGMRKAFGSLMEQIVIDHKNIIVMAADVANSAGLDDFARNNEEQFYNMGISEQNMTGVACGLAKEGYNVFITSFAPFVSMRNYEAVRSLVAYMQSNVKIIALSAGFSLGVQGDTHYALEDISLIRTVPNIKMLSPADVVEEALCLEYLADYEGPAYLRLTGIDGNPSVYKGDSVSSSAFCNMLKDGEDLAILCTGSITAECVRASRALKRNGLSVAVIDICQLKPFPSDFIRNILDNYSYVVTVEEHFELGGLGSMVEEVSAKANYNSKIIKIGIPDEFPYAANYSFLMEKYGLTASRISERIISECC